MMDSHVEIKDNCDDLETVMDEIAICIREMQFNYKLVERYTDIEEQVYEVYEWYEKNKKFLEDYMSERDIIKERLKRIEKDVRFLNHDVQNNKLQLPLQMKHGGSFSQLMG
jgi:predicted nuclease with TOPRIM domain